MAGQSGDLRQGYHYYCMVKINEVPLSKEELKRCLIEFEVGNIMSRLTLEISSNDSIVLENGLVEMSTIDVEMGQVDENDAIIDKKVTRYFLARTDYRQQKLMPKTGEATLEITGISDCYRYIGTPKTYSRVNVKAPIFLQEISGIGSGARGSGTTKLTIHDGLPNTAQDKQNWIQYDLTGIEIMNEVLHRVVKNPVGGGGGQYKSAANEHVYTAVADFDRSGNPELHLYDVKLRTLTFEPVERFSFKGDGFSIYRNAILDIKGSEQSAQWWPRSTFAFDLEENTTWYRHTRAPSLFPDSAPYADQIVFDGRGGPPGEFLMHRTGERTQVEYYNTNMYSRYYVDQKTQHNTTMMALRKINIKMSFIRNFYRIKPIDIIWIEYEIGQQDAPSIPDKKLTGRYMATHVAWEWDGEAINTYITGSRDSWVA